MESTGLYLLLVRIQHPLFFYLSVVQFGRMRGLGLRGRWFKSNQIDHSLGVSVMDESRVKNLTEDLVESESRFTCDVCDGFGYDEYEGIIQTCKCCRGSGYVEK